MIEYKIKNPKFFAESILLISLITDEGFFVFDDGLFLRGHDAGRVCFYELKISGEEVEIIKGGKAEVPIMLTSLSKILSRMKNTELMTIIFDDNINKLKIIGKVGRKNKTFSLSLYDFDNTFNVPMGNLMGLPLITSFKMPCSDLKSIIEDAEIHSDCITLESQPESIKFTTETIGCDMEIVYETGENYTTDISSYSTYFLRKFTKHLGAFDLIIRYTTDYPMAIHVRISDTTRLVYFLAPRVE